MSLADTLVPMFNPSKSQANELVRGWRRTKKAVTATTAFLPGNFIYTKYVALTPKTYDFNPVVIIIRANKHHVFGINVNWLSRFEKTKLMNFLISKDIQNKSRLEMIPIIRAIRRFRFTRKAYRLYHRKALAKPRIYKLDAKDLFDALMHNMRTEVNND